MPKIVDHVERRSAIAAAAAEVISEDGIEAATMKGIAARAGVTTGAVTHYFANKDDVVLAALLFVDAAMHARMELALELGRTPVDALLAALPNDPQSTRDWRVWRVFSDHAARSEPLRDQFRASTAAWVEVATDAMARRSSCDDDQARLDAELVVAVVDAIGDAASIDPESWPVDRQRRLLEHTLARASALS